MKDLKEYKFDSIYDLVSLIDGHVKGGSEFWNYDEELFVECATKFSKFTLLHLYTITTALNYYHRDFRKNGDCAYSAQIGHLFRSIPATCSRLNRPPDRSEATLVFLLFFRFVFLSQGRSYFSHGFSF
jgi:hypothetical protein